MARGSVVPVHRQERGRDGKEGKKYTVYRARVPGGTASDGKRIQVTKYHRTRKEADKWVAEQLTNPATAAGADPRMTVGELLNRWRTIHARKVGANTMFVHGWAAERIRAELGAIPVRDLSPIRVQNFYDRLSEELKPASIRGIHLVLKMALDLAIDWELLSRNVARNTRRPSVEKRPPAWWKLESMQAFLDHTRDDFDGPLFALILTTGLRIGEAIALDWGDVDLEAGRLTVARTMTRNAKGGVVVGTTTKSKSSSRTLVLPLPAQAALKRQLVAQKKRRADVGEHWIDGGAVFDRGDGARRHIVAARARFYRIIEGLGLPRLTPHGLRHTMATYLFGQRVPTKLISDLLGHASIEITLNIYTHVVDEDRGDVARVIEGAFTPPNSRPRALAVHQKGDDGKQSAS